MAAKTELSTEHLLRCRFQLTHLLENDDPYSMLAYLSRAAVHDSLLYPDLAIMDAYKAMLLAEDVLDDEAEYHEQALQSATIVLRGFLTSREQDEASKTSLFGGFLPVDVDSALSTFSVAHQDVLPSADAMTSAIALLAETVLRESQTRTAALLASLQCLRSAYTMIQNAITRSHAGHPHPQHVEEKTRILSIISNHFAAKGEQFDAETMVVGDLPDRGHVRREIYPWNEHELDRMSESGLQFLNGEMAAVAHKLQVKVAELPDLANPETADGRTKQLGVFAKEHILPGEQVLCERSVLTANMREHEPLCDACGSELPQLGSSEEANGTHGPVPCDECDDVAFCSSECLEAARESYHTSVCGMDIESIGKDVPAARAADAMYVQLMFRAIAMSLAQDKHPLDLNEVKFIWGDFVHRDDFEASKHQPGTLPYDFDSQVLQPLHLLEQLDISIFEPPYQLGETWVYNTLLAKFRGTASARISPRDGRPEVAAVHPLWCLANHACDPNVEWEWSGVIRFHARSKQIQWSRPANDGSAEETKPGRSQGIEAGEEILNHYVDIELPVADRREWGIGALGGLCECSRCRWEAGATPVSLAKLSIDAGDT